MNVSLLRRWLALSALVLFAATWRLWTPQTVFPQIPFLTALRWAPGWIDWIALTGMLVGLLWLLLIPSEPRPSGSGSREPRDGRQPLPDGRGSETAGTETRGHRAVAWSAALFVTSLTLLVLLDQHRLQVWAYQFAIVAVVLACVPPQRALSLLRLLTIGIYVWSAVAKLDYTFLHGLGPELLRGLLTAFQLEPGWMRPDVATALALAFPLDELAVAVLLAFRRTRLFGLIGSIAMHLLLLATLGPWGLDHSWGVLLWNVYFLGQNALLFAPQASGGRQLSRSGFQPDGDVATSNPDGLKAHLTPPPRFRFAARLASWVVYAAIALPVLEPFGWLDHWPGWAVYAPAGERVSVLVLDSDLAELRPGNVAAIAVRPSGFWTSYFSSSADRASLDALSVPMYPQGRFRVAVLLAGIERDGFDEHVVLVALGRADRLTGSREEQVFQGEGQLRAYADSFWLNTRPRKLGGW